MSRISDRSPTPKYQQLAGLIRDRIASGEFAAGERIPSEAELGASYQISRITTRQALADLERAGLLMRVPGKGTFVRHHSAHVERPSRLTGFSENLAALGLTPSYRTLRAGTEQVSAALAEKIHSPSATVYVVERVMCAGDTPVAIHTSYLPLWLVNAAPPGSFSADALNHGSMYQTIAETGARIFRADEIVEPGTATKHEASELMMPEHDLVLRVTRTVYDPTGTPLEHVLLTYRADSYTYRTTIFAGGPERAIP